MFAISDATELLHVSWHMQKLSFACHFGTRSPVLLVQVTSSCRSHTCGGFDPPVPSTTGTGAPQQLQPLTHPPGSTGAPLERQEGAMLVHTIGRFSNHTFTTKFGSLLGL